MTVKVITDSTSDISNEIAESLDITVVPIYLRFGKTIYRDNIDITSDEFYKLLTTSSVHPSTSQANPEDFTQVYKEYADKADGIISIHISSKISGTYNSAVVARNMMEGACSIEVVDSLFNSAGLALVTMAAARFAKLGHNLQDVLNETRKTVSQVHMFGMFDTMKYLALGGRVNKAIAAAGNILHVKPLLTFREGDITRAGLVRTVSKGLDRVYDFVKGKANVEELIITHSDIPEIAEEFKKRLSSLIPADHILISKLGAALGVHGGPGVLLVGLRVSEPA